jgi:protein involved in polysaccharide export with SLBB domain
MLSSLLACGCAAMSNPVGQGIPVRRLPEDYFAKPKEDAKTIALTLLRQKQPDVYRLDAGDMLGVYIEGVLGEKGQPPPLRIPEQGNLTPGLGFPIPVSEDGTLPLPLIKPLPVQGLTLSETRAAIVKAYTVDKDLLKAGKEQILVSLLRPRQFRVQVVRQDSAGTITVGPGIIGNAKRGTGATVDLPAYENDVLNALNRTGGLPGLDAINEIVIQRGNYGSDTEGKPTNAPPVVLRIPLRMRPGEPIGFQPSDVILKNGDIIFIEARDTEVFYTGGLLYPRQFVLPRDYDLHVVDAIVLAGGPLVNGGVTQNNLSGSIIASGLGSPSPSRVTVLRRTKGNGQIPIIVDLNLALNDPRENILMQAGDVLIMQETVGESLTRYLSSIFHLNFTGNIVRQPDLLGVGSVQGP